MFNILNTLFNIVDCVFITLYGMFAGKKRRKNPQNHKFDKKFINDPKNQSRIIFKIFCQNNKKRQQLKLFTSIAIIDYVFISHLIVNEVKLLILFSNFTNKFSSIPLTMFPHWSDPPI